MAKEFDAGNAITRQRMSRQEFYAAHEDGMAALKQHDHAGFSQAVERERVAIEKHSQAVDEWSLALRRIVREGPSE